MLRLETLSRSEDLIDDGQYMVDRSKYIVRGMTWSGWLSNKFRNSPQPKVDKAMSNISTGFICPDCKQILNSSEELLQHHFSVHSNNTSSFPDERLSSLEEPTKDVSTDQFLEQLGPQLAELKEIGLAMGNALDAQNKQLDRIDFKTEKTTDDMRKVTVKAAKLASNSLKVRFQHRVAFQECSTRLFMQSINGELVASEDIATPNTIFRAYTVGENGDIWGFQHEKSRYFIGINRYGNLRVAGKALKSYEQFAVNMDAAESPMFVYASYFGTGGWVSFDATTRKVSIVRGTAENKRKAARFKLVTIE